MVHDPGKLVQDRACGLRARRHVDAEHLLDGAHVAVAVDHGRAVVEPVGVRHDLYPRVGLRHPLEASVKVPALGLGRDDLLAVDAHHDTQRAVRRRVGRPEVQRHRLEHVRGVVRLRGELRLQEVFLGAQPALRLVIVLAECVADEPVMREEPLEVRVALEPDSHEVPGLALEPVRGGPDARERRDGRLLRGQVHAQPEVLVPFRRVEDVVRLETGPVLRREVPRKLRAVDGREIEEEVIRRRRVVPQEKGGLFQRRGVRDERRNVERGTRLHRHAAAELLLENRTERNGGRRRLGESRAHRRPSPARALAFAAASASAVSGISGSSFFPCRWAMTPWE